MKILHPAACSAVPLREAERWADPELYAVGERELAKEKKKPRECRGFLVLGSLGM
jgi:hypothetical protein